VLNVEVPPLRERGQDILLLARYFMQQACAQIQRPVCRLAPGTYPAAGNRWPGNVRQLQNVIFRAAAICESSLVDIGDLDIAGTSVARQTDSEVDSLEQAVELRTQRCWRNSTPATPRPPTGQPLADFHTPSPIACASTAFRAKS
jgi:transcriptional regulator of aromatic amino acid metabolism